MLELVDQACTEVGALCTGGQHDTPYARNLNESGCSARELMELANGGFVGFF
jgi:hypothetical protein